MALSKSKTEALQTQKIISKALEFDTQIDIELLTYNFEKNFGKQVIIYHDKTTRKSVEMVLTWFTEIGWGITSYEGSPNYQFIWLGTKPNQNEK